MKILREILQEKWKIFFENVLISEYTTDFNFVDGVYNRDKKEYLRRTKRVDKVVTKDLTKSDAVASFQKRAEEKSQLKASFWH